MSLLCIVKGLPTGYSSDLQETKLSLWDSLDAVKSSLEVVVGVIATLKVDARRMADVLSESYAFAVDLAESLATKTTLSFRAAHIVVGNLIKEMMASDMKPRDLNPEFIEMLVERVVRKKIRVDGALVKSVTDTEYVLSERKPLGSPSPKEVNRMLKVRREIINDYKKKMDARIEGLNQAKKRLIETVEKYL